VKRYTCNERAPPHKSDYDSRILWHLNRTTRRYVGRPSLHMEKFQCRSFKPFLTFSDLRRLTRMHRTTLMRHLNKLVKDRILIKYGPLDSKLDRENRTFYCANTRFRGVYHSTNTKAARDFCKYLSKSRRLGQVLMTNDTREYLITGGQVRSLFLTISTSRPKRMSVRRRTLNLAATKPA
jgi:hypothetical protein